MLTDLGSLLCSAMTEASGTSLRLGKNLHSLPFGLLVAGDDHLGNALAVLDEERLVGEIDKDDADLATIVGIDGAGSVEDGDAVLDGKTTAGAHLSLVARRQSHEETRRHKAALQGLQLYGRLDIGTKVHTCRLRRGILRQWMMTAIDYLYFHICMLFNVTNA